MAGLQPYRALTSPPSLIRHPCDRAQRDGAGVAGGSVKGKDRKSSKRVKTVMDDGTSFR